MVGGVARICRILEPRLSKKLRREGVDGGEVVEPVYRKYDKARTRMKWPGVVGKERAMVREAYINLIPSPNDPSANAREKRVCAKVSTSVSRTAHTAARWRSIRATFRSATSLESHLTAKIHEREETRGIPTSTTSAPLGFASSAAVLGLSPSDDSVVKTSNSRHTRRAMWYAA